MIGFNTHQANLFSFLVWDGSNFLCVLFLDKFLHCDNKEKWEIFVFLRVDSKEIAKNLENFTKISSRKKNLLRMSCYLELLQKWQWQHHKPHQTDPKLTLPFHSQFLFHQTYSTIR
jgi:hypothetical protein